MIETPEDFDGIKLINNVAISHEALTGQYFEGEYCPFLVSIDNMYVGTDINVIEVPFSVKSMLKGG